MATVVMRRLSVTVLLAILLRKDASAEELIRCFEGTATLRLSCPTNQTIWLKSGFYGVANDANFCRRPASTRSKDCLPNEQGHRWAISTDCNLFSNCVSYYKQFQAEAAKTCKVHGPTYSLVDYECLSRLQSDRMSFISHIYLSANPSQDVVDEKMFLMSDRYASSTSGETGYCQIRLPAQSGARFQLLDLRGRTIPASVERCPYKLYIYGAGNYKEWCTGSSFTPEVYSIDRSNSESVIDVVFQKIVPNGNAAVWLLMEGKSGDGSAVTGIQVNCGTGVVLQSLGDRQTMTTAEVTKEVDHPMTTATTTTTTEAERGGGDVTQSVTSGDINTPEATDPKVYYIFKSTMSAKIPGADGIVDNLAISRDSKGVDPILRMSFYSRDFGQQFYQDGQRIMNRVDNKCMAVNEKNQLILAECQEDDLTQFWIMEKDLGVVKNVELGDVVEVINNLPNSGALLGVGPRKEVAYQRFIFELAPTYFLIVNKSNGKVATLSSVMERSKIVMQEESATPNDNQIFYSDKKNILRTKINNFGIDTRSGIAITLRFLGSNRDNSWSYNSTLSKIVNSYDASSAIRVLQVKADMTLVVTKSTDDLGQRFDIRIVD